VGGVAGRAVGWASVKRPRPTGLAQPASAQCALLLLLLLLLLLVVVLLLTRERLDEFGVDLLKEVVHQALQPEGREEPALLQVRQAQRVAQPACVLLQQAVEDTVQVLLQVLGRVDARVPVKHGCTRGRQAVGGVGRQTGQGSARRTRLLLRRRHGAAGGRCRRPAKRKP
jgi:hypothetical protein